jgi:hypothetical protein
MKRLFATAAAILISSAAYLPTAAMAQPHGDFVRNGPPALRHEAVPHARRGYEWAPGYWNWNGRKYAWTAGHWEKARPGQHYRRPEWRQGSNGWQMEKGGWGR